LLAQQRTVIVEQCCVTLLHLLEKGQKVAVLPENVLLGGLRQTPGAVCDQRRPIQAKSRERKVACGGVRMETTIGKQQ
jgi:hypothetical protein